MSNHTPVRYPLPPGHTVIETFKPRKPQPVIDLAAEVAKRKARAEAQKAAESRQSAPDPPRVETTTPTPETPAPASVDESPAPVVELPPPDLDLSDFPGAESPAARKAKLRKTT